MGKTTKILYSLVMILFIIFRHDIVKWIRDSTDNRKEYKINNQNQINSLKSLNHSSSESSSHSGGFIPHGATPAVTASEYEDIPSRHGDAICKGCSGSGNCTFCGGTGQSISEEYDDVLDRSVSVATNCPACHGTGNCGVCYGTGKIHFNQ